MYNIKRRQQVWRQCVDLPPISISTVLLKLHQSTLSALPRSILSSSIEETELKCFIDDFTKWWGRYRHDIIGMILSGCWKIITPSSQFRVLASFAAFSWKTNPDSLNREAPSWQYWYITYNINNKVWRGNYPLFKLWEQNSIYTDWHEFM